MPERERRLSGETFITPTLLIMLATIHLAQGYKCAMCSCSPGKIDCSNQNFRSIPMDIVYQAYHNNSRSPALFISEFDASHNYITKLTPDTFKKLPNLKVLKLQHNKLGWINGSSFSHLTRLEELDLGYNRLVGIDAHAFTHVSSITKLYLPGNHLHTLSSGIFESLTNLEVLDLIYNPLSNSFKNMTFPHNIREIYLKGTGLEDIPLHLFNNTRNIRILDISENNLTSIPFSILNQVPDMININLSYNPWVCDCKLLPLKAWLAFQSVIINRSGEPVCNTPPSVAGTPVKQVAYSQFSSSCVREVRTCRGCFYPTRKPFLDPYNYMTGVNIAGSLLGMVLIFAMCFLYDRRKRRARERQREQEQLTRARSSANQLVASDSSHDSLSLTFEEQQHVRPATCGIEEPQPQEDSDSS